MKRDMDLIRLLLIGIDADPILDGDHWLSPSVQNNLGVIGVSDYSEEQVAYHLTLMIEAGLVVGNTTMEMPIISRLTWQGHELLDNVRDSGIWRSTKERVKDLPGIGIGVIVEVAKAEIKRHLGLPL